MKPPAILSIAIGLVLFCYQASAANSSAKFYTLNYDSPPGSQFLSFSGNMVIPKLPKAGIYYLWPGLQVPRNSGVYQNVLDGRTGSWWMASGYCCSNPSLGWGDGFSVSAGQTVNFHNVKRPSAWRTTLKREKPAKSVTNDFALCAKLISGACLDLANKTFKQAFFTVELYDVEWDFGRLEFKNILISATGKNTSWCYASPQVQNLGLNYHIGAVKATISKGVTTCHIERLILKSPGSEGSDRSSSSNSTTSVTTRKGHTSTKIPTSTGTALSKPTSAAVASPTQTAAGNRLTRSSWLLGALWFFVA